MHTKDKLADALLSVGLMDMSLKARGGYYHDFLSPLAMPEMQRITELADTATMLPDRKGAILALRNRVIDGDFDASTEESEEWANSAEGQETFRRLAEGE